MTTVDWYFDVVSPFAYLQHAHFDRLPPGLTVNYRPVLLAGLLKHWGQLGPAEIAPKRLFTYRFVTWLAKEMGIPLTVPAAHPFNPLPYLRLVIAAGLSRANVDAILRFVWTGERAVHDERIWTALARELGVLDPASAIAAPVVKDALRANGEAAIAAGVFGVPTFVVDGQIFFGLDATPMLLDYLRDPGRFAGRDMARLAALPSAAERR